MKSRFQLVFSLLLILCACRGQQRGEHRVKEATVGEPLQAKALTAQAPLPLLIPKVRLLAPEGADRWEPSGAAVIGDQLWIANDRGGYLAKYPLPLPESGTVSPTKAFALSPPIKNRIKWEGLEAQADGSLLILEAISRSIWRCASPETGCPTLEPVDLSTIQDKIDALPPAPFKYVMLESVFLKSDAEVMVGTRGYMPKRGPAEPLAAFFSQSGEGPLFKHPKGLREGGRRYGMSGATADAKGLWTTWSSEREDSVRSRDLFGLIAHSTAKGSSWSAPQICHRFQAKPEGIARWRDQLIVVFDEDLDRKGGMIPSDRFPLAANEDYVWSGPARCAGAH